MTQYVMIKTDAQHLQPSKGVVYRPVLAASAAARAATEHYPGAILSDFVLVVGSVRHEADELIDELHNNIISGAGFHGKLVDVLAEAMRQKRDICCWYGSDWKELPCVEDWNGLHRIMLSQAQCQPPELYFRVASTRDF